MLRCSGTEIPSRFTYVFLNSEDLNMVKIFVFVFVFFSLTPSVSHVHLNVFYKRKTTHTELSSLFYCYKLEKSREANRDFG